MFSRLLLLFIAVPAAELYLLIRIGQWIGAMETFGLIVITGIAGSWLAKSEGLSVWQEFNRKLSQGGMPGKELADGLIILVSGALLLTPGVLTDFAGLLGLLPFTRRLVRTRLLKWVSSRSQVFVGGHRVGFEGPGPGRNPQPDEPTAGSSESGWSGEAQSRPRHHETGT